MWDLDDRSSTSVDVGEGAVVQWQADDVILISGAGQAVLVSPDSGETMPLDFYTGNSALAGLVG